MAVHRPWRRWWEWTRQIRRSTRSEPRPTCTLWCTQKSSTGSCEKKHTIKRRSDGRSNALCMRSGCDFHFLICLQHKGDNEKHPHTVRTDNLIQDIYQKYPQLKDKATTAASIKTMALITPAPDLNGIKRKTNRTIPSEYHSNHLARESGWTRPNSSATRTSYAPISEDQWKEPSKTLVIFRKALQNWLRVSSQDLHRP